MASTRTPSTRRVKRTLPKQSQEETPTNNPELCAAASEEEEKEEEEEEEGERYANRGGVNGLQGETDQGGEKSTLLEVTENCRR